MAKAKRKAVSGAKPGDAVTPERWRRGDVELAKETIADEAGRPARPYRSIDTLAAMLRKGTITPAMRQAAEDFHAVFTIAQLDPLRAPDMARMPQHGMGAMPETSLRQGEAKKRVWQALQALGGMASPAGSCLWHVVGLEWTVKDWALREGWGGRPVSQEAASGVLVGALGVLQGFYRL
jgi:hypothetical protein